MSESIDETLRRVETLMALQSSLVADDRGDLPSVSGVDRVEDTETDSLSTDFLRKLVENRRAPVSDRRSALSILAGRLKGESSFSEILVRLLDDPEGDFAPEAIAFAPPFDSRILSRLRTLLADSRPSRWEVAAMTLARKKDRSILPLMLDWARRGDSLCRIGLAAVAFLLIPEQHLAVVQMIADDGPRDEEDEALLDEAITLAQSRVEFWRNASRTRPEL